MSLDSRWAVGWMLAAADEIDANAQALSELDRAIGDGDHGENLSRGFAAVRSELADADRFDSPADVLRTVALTLISSVGGAAGPLYGTAYLKAADAVGDREELDADAVALFLQAAVDGIELRGKGDTGEKTMVDAWAPAAREARARADAGESAESALRAAADAAEAGAASTDPMIARKGRASYLGERAIGHRDPGAASTAIILRAAVGAVRDRS